MSILLRKIAMYEQLCRTKEFMEKCDCYVSMPIDKKVRNNILRILNLLNTKRT